MPDVPLTVFGGQVSEMVGEDLPEGASPGAIECDFVPGAVFTRGGTQNQATLSPNPTVKANFNYVKTYLSDTDVATLALDASGVLWNEDVTNAEGTFTPIFSAIEPNTFAKSVTFDDVEYIALSNLTNGTDVPRQWNSQWLDRVSQVGPGAPPSVTATSSGSPISTITQNPPVVIPTSASGTSGSILLWSAAPIQVGAQNLPDIPGNVMSWYFPKAYVLPAYLQVGSNIVVSGVQTMNGFNPNSGAVNGSVTNPPFYTITSMPGSPSPTDDDYYIGFTVTVVQTGYFSGRFIAGSQFQATVATLTTTTQVPFLEVGNQFTVEGNSQAAYDQTWTVITTPNAAQLSITNTSVSGGVATYSFILITGTTPVVGQFVTVTGTINGNNIFNVVNAVITTVSGSTFTVNLPGPDIPGAAEDGNGIINGTIFTFDPAGVAVPPIIGTGLGGSIETAGVMGVGIRQCVCMFLTRNNFLTAPSPFVQFNINVSDNSITVSNIPIGPPNVKARVLGFTGAGGAFYFWIPQPVTVTSNGQQVTYNATIINDNTTTQVTLSFPDAVLLSATSIDVQGNNLFEQVELGSCTGFLTYSSRLIAWGEQNKIQNLLNLSFDGGIGVNTSQTNFSSGPGAVTSFPLGWTIDPVSGAGGSLIDSPIFGNSYYVLNSTGSEQDTYGMIEQSAYQDQFQTPIFQSGTLYSVRVAARCPSGATSGSLIVDLFSPKLQQQFGFFSVALASMTDVMQIFTGTLLTASFGTVPNDLLLRVYLEDVPNLGDVEIDRVEPFPTMTPNLSRQFRASYANNQEAFDDVTGNLGPNQNTQPINGGAVIFDTLYALKSGSTYSTSDNGVTEPDEWSWREVSNKVGTFGINSFDFGEGWLVTADRTGAYFFNGGSPIKITQENQPVWDLISKQYGNTVWVRNDIAKKQISIGIPIPTPNQFMPEMPANANPTSPNVVMIISYRELNTGTAMAETGPIKSTYSGRLLTPEPARKTSFWNIQAPYADFIDRGNNTSPLWLCSGYGTSELFALIDGQFYDERGGVQFAINGYWISYGFVKPDEADAKGLGVNRMLCTYFKALVTGAGQGNLWFYPDTPLNDLPIVYDPYPLAAISYGDYEWNVNWTANRFFFRFGTNAIGSMFRISKMIARLDADPWSPDRGVGVGVK